MNKKILSSMLILISLLIMNDQIFSYNPIKSIANYNQAKLNTLKLKKLLMILIMHFNKRLITRIK